MTNNKWQRVIALVCITSFLATSCTSLLQVSIPSAETTATAPPVQVGDSVVVTTKAGGKEKFEVTAIEPTALVGQDVRVPYADMASLGVKQLNGGKTTLAVILVVLVILIIVGADALLDGTDEAIELIPGM
jgi:hypothetical protein